MGVQQQLSEHSKGHDVERGTGRGVSTGAQRAKGKPVGKRTCRLGGVLRRRRVRRATAVQGSTFRLGVRLGTTAIDFDIGCTRKMNRGHLSGCP